MVSGLIRINKIFNSDPVTLPASKKLLVTRKIKNTQLIPSNDTGIQGYIQKHSDLIV